MKNNGEEIPLLGGWSFLIFVGGVLMKLGSFEVVEMEVARNEEGEAG